MKIIKRGTARQLTCRSCQSILEYEDSDVALSRLPDNQRDWDSSDREDAYRAHVSCPVCKHVVPVSVSAALKLSILEAQDRADRDI